MRRFEPSKAHFYLGKTEVPGGVTLRGRMVPPPIGVQKPLKIQFWGLTNVSFTEGKRTSVANGPFWASSDCKRYQTRLVNSTAVFSFKMDIGVVMTCVNFSFYRVSCYQLPFGAEPVSSFWFRRASVFCFESDSSTAYLLQFRFSCGHIIHWWHFEVKAWLTRGRSAHFRTNFINFDVD